MAETKVASEAALFAPLYMRDASALYMEGVALVSLEVAEGAKYGTHKLRLQDTVFHPQGGGQPSDTGLILSPSGGVAFSVLFVQANPHGGFDHYGTFLNRDGEACDLMSAFIDEDPFNKGVTLRVDAEKRALHAKLHSAGHAIDAAMLQLGHLPMLKAAKGYHFVDGPYVEYTCSPEFSMSAEELGNLPGQLSAVMREMVAERLETKVEFLSNQEAAELCKSDLAGYPAVVRVVTVAGNPCPCGGTHVENVALLEGIEITKAKIKKKILKISYVLN